MSIKRAPQHRMCTSLQPSRPQRRFLERRPTGDNVYAVGCRPVTEGGVLRFVCDACDPCKTHGGTEARMPTRTRLDKPARATAARNHGNHLPHIPSYGAWRRPNISPSLARRGCANRPPVPHRRPTCTPPLIGCRSLPPVPTDEGAVPYTSSVIILLLTSLLLTKSKIVTADRQTPLPL